MSLFQKEKATAGSLPIVGICCIIKYHEIYTHIHQICIHMHTYTSNIHRYTLHIIKYVYIYIKYTYKRLAFLFFFIPHRYDTPWCPVPDALSWPQQAGRLVELDRQPEQATNAMRGLGLPHPRNDRAPPFHIGRRPRSLLLAQAPAPQTKDFSSCTQGPRRRPEAMRAAEDPVW